MKFKVEERLLHHSQEDHSADPKLDSQKVLPEVGRKAHPKSCQREVVETHKAVKLQHWEILGCQQAIWALEANVDRCVELILSRCFHLKDVDAILDYAEQRLVFVVLKGNSMKNCFFCNFLQLTGSLAVAFALLTTLDVISSSLWNSILFKMMGPLWPHLWVSSSMNPRSSLNVRLSWRNIS